MKNLNQDELNEAINIAEMKAVSWCKMNRVLMESEEAKGCGRIGLVEAMKSFDESKGRFDHWLFIHVRRELVHHLRQRNFKLRKDKKNYKIVGMEGLEHKVEVKKGIFVKAEREEMMWDDHTEEAVIAKDFAAKSLAVLKKRDARSSRSKRMKKVISLYYLSELTMKEVGKVLGITEGRVSQVHTKAMRILRWFAKEVGNAKAKSY